MTTIKSSPLDAAIHQTYRDVDLSVDDILVDPAQSTSFAQAVLSAIAPTGDEASIPDVLRRLITLRKRGEDKGGLPRYERQNRGRSVKPR